MSTPKPPVTLCTAMTSKGKPCRLAPITGGTVSRTDRNKGAISWTKPWTMIPGRSARRSTSAVGSLPTT